MTARAVRGSEVLYIQAWMTPVSFYIRIHVNDRVNDTSLHFILFEIIIP